MGKPTKDQQRVIDSTSPKIAISASAGSGKTTTIINRIAEIIKMGHTTFDQLLVLTFTDASAQDMRQKLKNQLSKELGNRFSYANLQAAAIGTFHSFCASIIRAWFTIAEVSPSFTVMDTIESAKLKTAVFEKVVLDNYEKVKDAVDVLVASRSLDDLRDVVFKIHTFLETRHDKTEWLHNTALRAYQTNLEDNPVICALVDHYHRVAQRYRQLFVEFNQNSVLTDFVINLANQILAAKTYQEFQNLDLTFPQVKLTKDFDESLYEDFKNVRNKFKAFCYDLMDEFKFSVAEIQNDMQHDCAIVQQLLTLVELFDEAYSAKKMEFKKLDYNDLEKYALKVLTHPEAVQSIRAQYKYIFVDEGQDTNPVQYRIVDILRGDDKFFCIVGDIKQSIYGFRESDPELFDAIIHEDLIDMIRLNKNWRSDEPILHFVNVVMKRLLDDYETGHKFELQNQVDIDAVRRAVKIETAEDSDSQMELVYQQIVNAQYTLSEIAILCEKNQPLKLLQKYLMKRGVSCVVENSVDILQEPEVALLNHFLFATMNPTNDLSRYFVLQYFFHCTNDELAHLRLEQFNPTLTEKVAKCDAVLAKYRALGRAQSTYEVLTQVATEFGMLEIPIVNTFLTTIRGVSDFDTVARYLYLIEHDIVKLEVNVGANVKDAVRLMTIHHSKGLEFPMVILYDVGATWSSALQKNSKIIMDKNMGISVLSVDAENYVQKSRILRYGIAKYQDYRQLEEKKRLLYVALTRPKEKLYIVGKWKYNPNKFQPNSMMDLINPLGLVEERHDVEFSPEVTTEQTTTEPIRTLCHYQGYQDQLVKQSVTALASAAEPFQDYIAPVKYQGNGGKDFGTEYHRQLQYGKLPAVVEALVAGYTTYRELPFLYMQDQTMVQGIMDLLAVKEQEAIIVDYKTTRLPQKALVEKYREQLHLYAQALPQYQVTTYIYSTVHDELIKVSF